MGLEWLNRVESTLKDAGFRVEIGYPGKKAAHLTRTVAAVNLTGMDTQQQRLEVTVTMLTPRLLGLAACQEGALAALEALSADGNRWSFSGWRYEELIDCYAIEVLGVSEEGDREVWQVLIGTQEQPYVTGFLAKQDLDRRLLRPHGQSEPVGVTPGEGGWTIRLTQMLPGAQAEPEAVAEPFRLTLVRGSVRQVYSGCYWSEYSARQSGAGLEVIRAGLALSREES